VRKWWWWGVGGGGDGGSFRAETTHRASGPSFVIGKASLIGASFSGCFRAALFFVVFFLAQGHTVRLNVVSPLHSREQDTSVERGGQLPQKLDS